MGSCCATAACLPCMAKSFVHAISKAIGADRFPHQPEFQAVNLAAALHRLISNIKLHIIEFILLEEVCGVGTVAIPQQVLRTSRMIDYQRFFFLNIDLYFECQIMLAPRTMVSCSSRAEHWRPVASILCGFQATEFALITDTYPTV